MRVLPDPRGRWHIAAADGGGTVPVGTFQVEQRAGMLSEPTCRCRRVKGLPGTCLALCEGARNNTYASPAQSLHCYHLPWLPLSPSLSLLLCLRDLDPIQQRLRTTSSLPERWVRTYRRTIAAISRAVSVEFTVAAGA